MGNFSRFFRSKLCTPLRGGRQATQCVDAVAKNAREQHIETQNSMPTTIKDKVNFFKIPSNYRESPAILDDFTITQRLLIS